MTFGGDGLARHQSLVVFVPFSAPGDLLKVRIVEKKKSFARAEIVEILTPSPQRVSPPCPVYGRCGGCDWQHLKYSAQLEAKESIVREKLGRFANSSTVWNNIVPSTHEFSYRNRIQLKYKAGKLGYFARKSHDLVEISRCPIAEEALNSLIPELQSDLKKNNSPDLAKLELMVTKAGKAHVNKEAAPYEDLGFSQVNTKQNERLIEAVRQWASESPFEEFWDLYAGHGNFTFPLFEAFPRADFKAVELSQKNVQLAQEAVRSRNLSPKKLSFFLADVRDFLKRASTDKRLSILVDPPRAGLDAEVVQNLREMPLSSLLYVSCDPSSLARDVEKFVENSWSLQRVQPFDMFPQTNHIETLVELKPLPQG